MNYVGIDLAGSDKNKTGFCVLDEKLEAKTWICFKDEEILKSVEEIKPKIVAIDAPLALPLGRKSIEKRNNIHFRECDKELLKMRIKFFPITLGPMRMLTKRGIKLRKILEKKGFEVIETFPGAAQDILKIPRKSAGSKKLLGGLKCRGIKILKKSVTDDELDAITCALVAKMYDEKNYIALGNKKEILLILPKPQSL
jgi:predicted nuclease with RNAse H fold